MNTALRPMSTGEVLDRTFHLYRNHFLLFSGISVGQVIFLVVGILAVIPMGALLPLSNFNSPDPFTILGTFGVYSLFIFLFYGAGYAVVLGATVYAVSKVHLGQPTTIRASYRDIRPLVLRTLRIVLSVFIRYVGTVVLSYLVVIVVGAVVVPNLIRAVGAPLPTYVGWMLVASLLGLFVAGMVLAFRIYCRYSLAVPACLLEMLPARQAMKRSKWLSKGALGRIFLIFLLMAILTAGLTYALQIPVLFLSAMEANVLIIVCQLLGMFIAITVAAPISTISMCLVYYDQRVRKEAFDLQLMMEAVGQQSQVQAAAAVPPIA